jgi:hypothetical protein
VEDQTEKQEIDEADGAHEDRELEERSVGFRCARGFGTSTASRAMKSSGSKIT